MSVSSLSSGGHNYSVVSGLMRHLRGHRGVTEEVEGSKGYRVGSRGSRVSRGSRFSKSGLGNGDCAHETDTYRDTLDASGHTKASFQSSKSNRSAYGMSDVPHILSVLNWRDSSLHLNAVGMSLPSKVYHTLPYVLRMSSVCTIRYTLHTPC